MKKEILEKISQIEQTINTNEIEVPKQFLENFKNLSSEIENFKIFLPLIGSFNAGKSSLLNSYLETQELFPTNIVPETALATELHLCENGKNERIEAYKFDIDKPAKVCNEISLELAQFDYLKIYKKSEILKNSIVLVDMPGFDSNIERHNKSLFKYMEKKVSFILVIDIEDGAIKLSTLRFLKEIRDYRLDFFVILNKIDKKLPNEVEQIHKYIQEQLSLILPNAFIGKVSAIDDNIDDFKNIIANLDIDDFIKKLHYPKLEEIKSSILFDLETRKNLISCDVEEIDKKILDIHNNQKRLQKELQNEKIKIENEFMNLANIVVQDVENTLHNSLDELIRAIEVSQTNFSQKVNEIIRPVIISKIKNYSEKIFAERVKSIEINNRDILLDINSKLSEVNVILNEINNLSEYLGKFASVISTIITKFQPIVIIVRAIVSLFSELFRVADNRDEKIREELANRVIPNISMQILPDIENSINNIKDEFFYEVEKDFDNKFENLQNSLEQAKREIQNRQNEVEQEKQKFVKLIEAIKTY